MTYAIHYADNHVQRITMLYGDHVRSWWTAPNEPLWPSKRCRSGWGTNPKVESA